MRKAFLSSLGFHLIGFPSEWGAEETNQQIQEQPSFHLIGFPSEWGNNPQEGRNDNVQ